VSGTGGADAGEEVVLVDEEGRDVGRSGKLAAHAAPGQLHRAVSVFVFSPAGHLLLQRRAPVKYHFAGRWSNTCCGHPRPGEPVVDAGRRRLVDELGMDCELVEVATFRYEALDEASGLVERELDHLLVGVAEADPDPRPHEVDAVRWVGPDALVAEIAGDPGAFTPWLPGALGRVIEARRGAE
jgi:isopentenyl-diphosphate delta-isomerase